MLTLTDNYESTKMLTYKLFSARNQEFDKILINNITGLFVYGTTVHWTTLARQSC